MAKFLIELWLDGYDSESEMEIACEEFIYEQLNMTASSVKITKIDTKNCPKNYQAYDQLCTNCEVCKEAKLYVRCQKCKESGCAGWCNEKGVNCCKCYEEIKK